MTNDEYFVQLEPVLAALAELRSQAIKLAAGMIGETLFSEDLFLELLLIGAFASLTAFA